MKDKEMYIGMFKNEPSQDYWNVDDYSPIVLNDDEVEQKLKDYKKFNESNTYNKRIYSLFKLTEVKE